MSQPDEWMTLTVQLPAAEGRALLAFLRGEVGFEAAEHAVPGHDAKTMSRPDGSWTTHLVHERLTGF